MADMYTKLQASRSYLYATAREADAGNTAVPSPFAMSCHGWHTWNG
jgi:alkylation response protein AidB-like acyl-CoA dehydrogenase